MRNTIPPSPRTIRRRLGMSLVRVAGLADVSVTSARIYEIDPREVSLEIRLALDAFYRRAAAELGRATAAEASLHIRHDHATERESASDGLSLPARPPCTLHVIDPHASQTPSTWRSASASSRARRRSASSRG